MAEKRLGSVLCAIALAAGSACALQKPSVMTGSPKDVGTPIILLPSESQSSCTVSFKQPVITSHADKWLTFKVLNYCGSSATVIVGNFRTKDTPSTHTDCANAMDDGTAPAIFQQDDLGRRTATPDGVDEDDPGEAGIKLKLKKAADLPPGTGPLEYDFDVCLGSAKADPRLVVER